ncbi:thiol oxidoreductase [Pseudenhygromyxa sp. WMMC2535]|uniref:di-heme oxidoreductase family protein n=1 Tax=Pseudenhygromyxa sp. WMMC2535 TaxID=2712867 RepID=UPI0015573102|nr:di-heme oxidoredictase family protein [Pseudenhygromyxa sp. WMMC2535]NVB38159.1 thiol oxidoreductase [Pseudenhygromyxa sp. WMMC2535]
MVRTLRLATAIAPGLLLPALFACTEPELAPEPGEELAGGGTTVFETGRRAFMLIARNVDDAHETDFYVGNSFFNKNWVIAPSSTTARDGLGPTYNATSCSACHLHDGRGHPPLEDDEAMLSMLVRLSIPGADEHGGPLPDPIYGDQLQPVAVPGVTAEGRGQVTWTELPGHYADGEAYSLREPSYALTELAFGEPDETLMLSPRVAPQMIGLGLLEAIEEDDLLARADPDDADGDGISGRPNYPWDPVTGVNALGRFGWKANQVGLNQQNSAAFAGDIGITSSIHGVENCPAPQAECAAASNGGSPEISDDLLESVLVYSRLLAVPARRDVDDPQVLDGRERFYDFGCADCHVPRYVTGDSDYPELANQQIWPYTDLLLHDMGPELADGRPDYDADGQEWRTPPLWGVGLFEVVNGHSLYLHDGRARGLAEAILWHGGEGEAAREAFVAASADDRAALLRFVETL